MKYCTKCGAVCSDNTAFCSECGSPLPEDGTTQNDSPDHTSANNSYSYNNMQGQTGEPGGSYNYHSQGQPGGSYNYYSQGQPGGPYNYHSQGQPGGYQPPRPYIAPRGIAMCILLSIVTCGIYSIYWMIKLNDEINLLAGDMQAPSGGMVFLLSIVTCGIYSFYWLYKMGDKCDFLRGMKGNSNILYLLLALFGLSIVSYCLIQDTINKIV